MRAVATNIRLFWLKQEEPLSQGMRLSTLTITLLGRGLECQQPLEKSLKNIIGGKMTRNFSTLLKGFLKKFKVRKWRRIPRRKVPHWVRGKLYKQNVVKDKGREYKRLVESGVKSYTNGLDPVDQHYEVYHKRWKKYYFYYRKV